MDVDVDVGMGMDIEGMGWEGNTTNSENIGEQTCSPSPPSENAQSLCTFPWLSVSSRSCCISPLPSSFFTETSLAFMRLACSVLSYVNVFVDCLAQTTGVAGLLANGEEG